MSNPSPHEAAGLPNPANDDLSLGKLPVWNLADLYPGPDAPELAKDLENAAGMARHIKEAYHGKLANGSPWQLYVKGNNLTDRLAYAHTSFIKTAAPLMGRNITVGVKVAF